MAYPVKTVVVLLSICAILTFAELSMSFLRLQYAYFFFLSQSGVILNSSDLNPCGTTNSSIDADTEEKLSLVHTRSSVLSTLCSLITGGLGLSTIIPIGCLADFKGRKLTIIFTSIGIVLGVLINGCTIFFQWPIWLFYIASIFPGVTGNGAIGLNSQILTSLADISNFDSSVANSINSGATNSIEEDIIAVHETSISYLQKPESSRRTDADRHRLILMCCCDCAVGFVFALSPYLVGESIKMYGFLPPVWLALGACILAAILVVFLPETSYLIPITSPLDSQTEPDTSYNRSYNSFLYRIKHDFDFFNSLLFLGVLILFLLAFILYSDSNVSMLYLMGQPFCWNPANIGIFMGLRAGSSAFFVAVVSFVLIFCKGSSSSASTAVCLSTDEEEELLSEQTSEVLLEPSPSDPPAIALAVGKRNWVIKMCSCLATILTLMSVSRLIFGLACRVSAPFYNYLVYIALIVGTIAFYTPLIKALVSNSLRSNAQGKLLSICAFGEVLGMLLGQTLQPMLYSSTLTLHPGFVFLFSSAVLFITVALSGVMAFFALRQSIYLE